MRSAANLYPGLSPPGGGDAGPVRSDQDRGAYTSGPSDCEIHLSSVINWEEKGYSGCCEAKTVAEVEKARAFQKKSS